jgi:hypothetical protein
MNAGVAEDELPTSPLLERIRRGIIGDDLLMDGPYGPRRSPPVVPPAAAIPHHAGPVIRDTSAPRTGQGTAMSEMRRFRIVADGTLRVIAEERTW